MGIKDKLTPFGILEVMTDCSPFSLGFRSKPVILLSTVSNSGGMRTNPISSY